VTGLAALGRSSGRGKNLLFQIDRNLQIYQTFSKVFGRDKKFLEIYKTNINVKKYQHIFKKCVRDSLVRFVGFRLGVATWVNAVSLSLESGISTLKIS